MAVSGLHHLASLHPQFAQYVRQVLDIMDEYGCEPLVTEGLRSPERQDQLYSQGRTRPGQIVTNARAWQNAHQYGLAVDVTSRRGYQSKEQQLIHAIFRETGFGIVRGDLPHGEYPGWRAIVRALGYPA